MIISEGKNIYVIRVTLNAPDEDNEFSEITGIREQLICEFKWRLC